MNQGGRDAPNPISIALLGTRGVPARYGGFETFAEEISRRLVARGHRVTVYGRCRFFESCPRDGEYQGVRLRITPTIMHKYAETPVHAATSFLDLLRQAPDIVLLCNAANSPFAFLAKLQGLPLVINVDGIERRRKKWNRLGQLWYRLGEWCSVWWANRLIADADVIATYLQSEYGVGSDVIAYGGSVKQIAPGPTLAQFGLKPREYILYVSRLEPENNALGVIEAYERAQEITLPLVIVGDAPYADAYKARLRAAASERVIFTGFQFGDAYHELQANAAWYIQATEVGGTHPALVEAMAHGNCIIANGTPENCEVLGDAGLLFPMNDFVRLTELLKHLSANPSEVDALRSAAAKRAGARYSWDAITDQYEALLTRIVAQHRRAS